jgi:hypothetical protein
MMSTSRLCVIHCLPSAIRLEEFIAVGAFRACAERRNGEVLSNAPSVIDTAQARTVVLRFRVLMNDRRRMPNHSTRGPPLPSGYTTDMDLPVACTLADAELRERRATILDSVRHAVVDITSLPDGYLYRFDSTSEILSHLARLVDLERQCCAFLTFRIIVAAGRKPICLEITGPPEAKRVIADFFGP